MGNNGEYNTMNLASGGTNLSPHFASTISFMKDLT